jgi:HNH endonuclease
MSEEKYNLQLGTNVSASQHKLTRLILYDRLIKLGEDNCYRCGLKISSYKEFSIEHKISWINNDPNLFWDLNNIAFSHLLCNQKAPKGSTQPNVKGRRVCIDGQSLCKGCNKMLDKDLFGYCSNKFFKIKGKCKKCRGIQEKFYKDRKNT